MKYQKKILKKGRSGGTEEEKAEQIQNKCQDKTVKKQTRKGDFEPTVWKSAHNTKTETKTEVIRRDARQDPTPLQAWGPRPHVSGTGVRPAGQRQRAAVPTSDHEASQGKRGVPCGDKGISRQGDIKILNPGEPDTRVSKYNRKPGRTEGRGSDASATGKDLEARTRCAFTEPCTQQLPKTHHCRVCEAHLPRMSATTSHEGDANRGHTEMPLPLRRVTEAETGPAPAGGSEMGSGRGSGWWQLRLGAQCPLRVALLS